MAAPALETWDDTREAAGITIIIVRQWEKLQAATLWRINMDQEFLTRTKAAAYLDTTEDALDKLLKSGHLPYHRIGTRIFLLRREIDAALEAMPGRLLSDVLTGYGTLSSSDTMFDTAPPQTNSQARISTDNHRSPSSARKPQANRKLG
jgi:excisionase family DNA binding protein